MPYSVTTDKNGNVYITGYVKSADFPTYDPGGSTFFQGTFAGPAIDGDVFVLRFEK